ncbi:MAG: hypothetical protein JWL90_2130 [Chthoniobacteraceae bacterium]|nr:hypothetical protein [Chthoniobacteraceae bacterium]
MVRRPVVNVREFESACREFAPGVSGIRFLDPQLAAAGGKSLLGYSQPVRAVVEFAGNDKEFAGGDSEFTAKNKEHSVCAREFARDNRQPGPLRDQFFQGGSPLSTRRLCRKRKSRNGERESWVKRSGYAAAFISSESVSDV